MHFKYAIVLYRSSSPEQYSVRHVLICHSRTQLKAKRPKPCKYTMTCTYDDRLIVKCTYRLTTREPYPQYCAFTYCDRAFTYEHQSIKQTNECVSLHIDRWTQHIFIDTDRESHLNSKRTHPISCQRKSVSMSRSRSCSCWKRSTAACATCDAIFPTPIFNEWFLSSKICVQLTRVWPNRTTVLDVLCVHNEDHLRFVGAPKAVHIITGWDRKNFCKKWEKRCRWWGLEMQMKMQKNDND